MHIVYYHRGGLAFSFRLDHCQGCELYVFIGAYDRVQKLQLFNFLLLQTQIPSPLTEEMAAAKKEKSAEKKKAKKTAMKERKMVRVVMSDEDVRILALFYILLKLQVFNRIVDRSSRKRSRSTKLSACSRTKHNP